MKLITEIKSIENIHKYDVDGIIFADKNFSTISDKTFSFPEIERIVDYCKDNNKLAILKIDKIISENELQSLNTFLEEIIKLDIDYYLFTDMAVLNFMRNVESTDRLIFAAKTLNCSYNDSLFYRDLGIKVLLSNELTLEDIKDISRLDNIVLDGYGYTNIFYSKRSLLSLFAKHYELNEDYARRLLFIKEEKRENKYPLSENDNGTFIFNANKYMFFKELELVKNLFMFKIESIFIDEEELFKVISIYKRALAGQITDSDYQELLAIDEMVSSGFLYKKPRILKKE